MTHVAVKSMVKPAEDAQYCLGDRIIIKIHIPKQTGYCDNGGHSRCERMLYKDKISEHLTRSTNVGEYQTLDTLDLQLEQIYCSPRKHKTGIDRRVASRTEWRSAMRQMQVGA